MSDALRAPTPEHEAERDVKPALPITPTGAGKGGKPKAKASPKRKSPPFHDDAGSSSDDKKPNIESDIDEKPSSPKKGKIGDAKKRAKASETPGEFTQAKKDQLAAAVFLEGLQHTDKALWANKASLPLLQLTARALCGEGEVEWEPRWLTISSGSA